jgi:hypothetical protein
VPQQQILPASACLQSSSVGLGFLSRRALADTTKPVAALHGVPLAVGLDQRTPFGIGGDAFNGFDGFAFALDGKRGAGKDGPSVDDDGAGAADTAVAHLFGAGQSELELEGSLEGPVGLDEDFVILAVHLELGRHRLDVAGMRGGEVGFQRGVGIEVLAVNRTFEIGDGGGGGLCDGGDGRFRRKRHACAQSASGHNRACTLEKTPSVESASFVGICNVFISHYRPLLGFITSPGLCR